MKKLSYHHPWVRVGFVGVLLVIAFTVIGLLRTPKSAEVDESLRVAATIFPIYDLVRSIGGERVNVKLLLPEGESPAALPNIYSGARFDDTRAVFAIGLGYDTEGIPLEYAEKIVTLEKGIDLLLEQGSEGNPNYWLSVKNMQQMARTVTSALSTLDPESKGYFASNLEQKLMQLENLDIQIRSLFSGLPRKQMIVYGYDWSYFAREYGFDIVDYEVAGNLSASRVEELRKAASEYGLTAMFTDIRLSPEALLPAMAKQYLSLYHLDIYGGVEDRKDYIATMAYNARSIYDGITGAP